MTDKKTDRLTEQQIDELRRSVRHDHEKLDELLRDFTPEAGPPSIVDLIVDRTAEQDPELVPKSPVDGFTDALNASAFGITAGGTDGLTIQQQMRDEWT